MSEQFQARLIDDVRGWDTNTVRLAVRRGDYGANQFLLPDGTWSVLPEGTIAVDIGIVLPRGAIEAIAVAIAQWQGHTNHADTEAKVLREWLAVERQRVDEALRR